MLFISKKLDGDEIDLEFSISAQNIEKCFRFAEEIHCREAGSRRDFGTEAGRGTMDYIADHVRGKMAEFAFQSFLIRNFIIVPEVDIEVYDGCTNTDDGSDLRCLCINGSLHRLNQAVDVKNIGPRSQWLLIERHKFGADAYIVGRIVSPGYPGDNLFAQNPYKYKDIDWRIRFQGYALRDEIYHSVEQLPWFQFRRGEKLFKSRIVSGLKNKAREMGPEIFSSYLHKEIDIFSAGTGGSAYIGPNLKAELNYAYPVNWLRNISEDWMWLKEFIIQNSERVHSNKAGHRG